MPGYGDVAPSSGFGGRGAWLCAPINDFLWPSLRRGPGGRSGPDGRNEDIKPGRDERVVAAPFLLKLDIGCFFTRLEVGEYKVKQVNTLSAA